MASRFETNFTDKGYVMKYEKLPLHSSLKSQVLQFFIALQGIEPKIWRRIQVPSDYNFWDLHVAIQDAIGWQDYHLHHFEIKGKGKGKEVCSGIQDFEGSGDLPEVFPGWEIAVIAYFNALGVEAVYEYDYGDGWLHTVKLEGYIFREKGIKYPICIDGKNACPPEDCGGVDGSRVPFWDALLPETHPRRVTKYLTLRIKQYEVHVIYNLLRNCLTLQSYNSG